MWKIKKAVLLSAVEASWNFLPDEFMCFLSGDKKTQTINEIVFLPSSSSADAVSINDWIIPFDESILGSFHSHPNGIPFPSSADKRFFARFSLNAILGSPFAVENIRFFDYHGKRIEVSLID